MLTRLVIGVLLFGLVPPVLAQSTGPLAVEDRSAAGISGAVDGSVANDGLMLIMQQLQQYEQEIGSLRGQLEEVTHALEKMRQAERERYLDLDARINALAGSNQAAPIASNAGAVAGKPAATAEQDRSAYMAGREKLLANDFPAAKQQFEQYLSAYPQGQFRPFAHFWLGEIYRGQSTPDRQAAIGHFRKVVSQYPQSAKVPSALYKLALLEAQSGDQASAKITLEKVIAQFPQASEAALAKSMLRQLK